MTFARFLASQRDRTDWIGDLARAGARDNRFPRSGEPLDIYNRVKEWVRSGASSDAMHALQAALDEWAGRPYSLADDDSARRRVVREASVARDGVLIAQRDKRVRRNKRRRKLYAEKRKCRNRA